MKKSKRYWIAPNLNWKAFKKLYDSYPDSGPTILHGAQVLWKMLRERKINIYVENSDDGFVITTKDLPKGEPMLVNPK